MAVPTIIQHPLLRRPGSSQRKRISDGLVPQLDADLIDNRSLADLLDYIHQYARQLVFPAQRIDEAGAAYVELSNWLPFFEDSLPFRLTRFGKIDFDRLEGDLAAILDAITRSPDPDTMTLLLDFCFFELIAPIDQLQKAAGEFDFALTPYLNTAIHGSLSSPLKRFIQLCNTASAYFCVERRRFADFINEPWRIPEDETYGLDESITMIPGSREGALLWLKDELAKAIFEMLRTLRQTASQALNYLQASLEVSQGRHEPHLGLLFVFLRLFRLFQGDLNRLTRKHVDFFYQQVLQIKPKELVRDKAHLVFQVAKHLPSYLVKQATIFKDGKDSKNLDILFSLDEEIVIDKAQVVDLKTLYLNPTQGCLDSNGRVGSPHSIVEGVYIAPVANSADGKGKPFKDDQSKNWATLGAKFGKYIAPGKDAPEALPFGRIGFVLASPVLLLAEGKRTVTITIECDATGNQDIFSPCYREHIADFLTKKFYKVSEQTVKRIEALFSLEAQTHLRDLLDSGSPIRTQGDANVDEFLQTPIPSGGKFTAQEIEMLRVLLEADDPLREMPFASLIRDLNVLRLQQDPYDVGFDPEAFFQTRDPISCRPLLNPGLLAYILPLLDVTEESSRLFQLQFSGEDGWFEAKGALEEPLVPLKIDADPGAKKVTFTFNACLEPTEPKVTFYDQKAIKETFETKYPFPMVKIELNPKIQLDCESHCEEEPCCLGVRDKPHTMAVALYHFFRNLKVERVDIAVMVCGMRDLIVQNEESLQDVNSPILPFGARPKLGAEFYIGSKELFGKNWQRFWICADWKDKPKSLKKHYENYHATDEEGHDIEITDRSFKFRSAILDDRKWNDLVKANPPPRPAVRSIFQSISTGNSCPRVVNDSTYCQEFRRYRFPGLSYRPKSLRSEPLAPLTVSSDAGFFRMTLQGVSFQHDIFPFVLARNLFQLSGKLDPLSINDILNDVKQAVLIRDEIAVMVDAVASKVSDAAALVEDDDEILDPTEPDTLLRQLTAVKDLVDTILEAIKDAVMPEESDAKDASDLLADPIAVFAEQLVNHNAELAQIIADIQLLLSGDPVSDESGVTFRLVELHDVFERLQDRLQEIKDLGLPKEPYTPLIKSLELDYCATADNDDIDLIHLYPFANTSRLEFLDPINPGANVKLGATLLPTFTDEGTLFIGLDEIRAGSNVQLLFQFAEATADSESKRAEINWHYLTGNRWQPLRRGFEIVSDDTQRMTRSGIVKIALPPDITNVGNTLMPPQEDGKHLYWLKVSAPDSTATVAELLGVHAQAAAVTYQPLAGSDTKRVSTVLAPMSIGKSLEPDFNIKKVEQPYESFGGQVAEGDGHVYVRVSEYLRHKGRSVDIFDLEHLVLEAFPQLFKCKCISHTMGLSAHQYRRDLEVAPGYITVAVVPDLGKLKAGDMLEPKAPVTLLTDIKAYLVERISPFARIRVMNPRYERIRVDVTVRLTRGRDESYSMAQLKTDLTHFLAPWYLGDSDKMSFGQHVVYSDVVGFIENLDYIEFITDLHLIDSEGVERTEIVPLTARSILTAGRVCIDLDREDCDEPAPPPPSREKPTSILRIPDSLPCGTGRPFGLVMSTALNQQQHFHGRGN